mgnify:CR=1 FL=1
MKTEIEERIAAIKEKQKERDELLDKLLRYRDFEAEYGIAPHEISRILLKPVDRKSIWVGYGTRRRSRHNTGRKSVVVYDSYVTTKDGEEHIFRGVNIKAILDGEK